MCPAGRDRRCLRGVGGIFLLYILPIGNFILDLSFTNWYYTFHDERGTSPAVLTGRDGSAGTSGIGVRVGVWGWETTVDLSDTVRQPQETTRTLTRTI